MKLVNAAFANQKLATSSGEIQCDECGVAEVKDQAMAEALMGMGWRIHSDSKPAAASKKAVEKEEVKEEVASEEKPKKFSKK